MNRGAVERGVEVDKGCPSGAPFISLSFAPFMLPACCVRAALMLRASRACTLTDDACDTCDTGKRRTGRALDLADAGNAPEGGAAQRKGACVRARMSLSFGPHHFQCSCV